MLLKPRNKNKLYDLLHHGSVYVCMGVTLAATGYLCFYGYKYFTEIKPNLKTMALKKIEAAPETKDTAKTVTT